MRITVLAIEQSLGHAGARRSRRVASLLADSHQVEVLSLHGSSSAAGGSVASRALLRRTSSGDEPVRDHGLTPAVVRSATATSSTQLPGQHVLAESELQLALRTLHADLVILTDPQLGGYTRQTLDPAIPLAVMVDDLTTPSPDLAVADAVLAPGAELARGVTELLGEVAPPVHVVPPHAWRTPADEPGRPVIAAVGTGPDRAVLESAVDAFVTRFPRVPGWSINLTHAGPRPSDLAARAENAGVHGAVTVSSRAVMENDVLPHAASIVVATHDVGDAMTTILNGVARGARVRVDTADPDVANLVREAPGAAPWPESDAVEAIDTLIADSPSLPESSTLAWLDRRRSGSLRSMLDAISSMTQAAAPVGPDTLVERGLRARHRAGLEQPDVASVPTPATRPPEDRLLARNPDLIRWAGTLNEEHDALLEPEILARNLTLTASALAAVEVDFVVISSVGQPGRIAVESQDGPAAVDALRARCAEGVVYTERIDSAGRRHSRTLGSQAVHDERDAGIVVYVPIVSRTRSLRYGPAHGCTIEFWRRSTDPRGFASPLAPSRRGTLLTSLSANSSIAIAGSELPTTREVTARRLDDIDFPIDAVWTWVDDTDPAWRERRLAAGSGPVAVNGDDASRFNNRDELRYSLRSVAMYAPWIRHLYIVTDGQRPVWLADHPRVTVVDHREIFADPGALPTFNSHAIEGQLHHIEGLAENFLYFNDDVFLGRRVTPDLFFTSTQQSKSFMSPTTIPPGPPAPDDLGFYASRKNNRTLIEQAFGRTMVHGYLHTPHALRVSVLDEMEQRFSTQWARTQHSRFRSPDDIAIASSLHHAYGHLTGRSVEGTMRSRYVKAGLATHQALMRQILSQRNLDAFCLNDTADRDLEPDLQTDAIRAMLEAYFPMAAPWERH